MQRFMITRIAIVAAVSLTVAAGCGTSSQGRPEVSMIRAEADRDPQKARQLNREALEQIEREDLEQAETLLRRALRADPTYGPAHNNLGRVYFDQHRLHEAAWRFEYAIELMPDKPEPRNNLGLVMESARRLEDARDRYEQARQRAPDNAEILANLIRTRLAEGERSPQLRELLGELILKEERPQWIRWAREQHALQPQQPREREDANGPADR